jgi:hypothetical protein
VLFVAEKMAALNVVYRRLEVHGLGEFCLELHSNKANKADVIRQLGRAWETRDSASAEDWARDAAELRRLRQSLNNVVRRLHERHSNGMTIHKAIGRVVRQSDLVAPVLAWPADREHDVEAMVHLRDAVRRLGINAQATADLDRRVFDWIGQTDWSTAWQSELVNSATLLGSAVDRLGKSLATLISRLGLPAFCAAKLEALSEIAQRVVEAAGIDLSFAFAPNFSAVSQAVDQGLTHIANYRATMAKFTVAYRPDACLTVPIEALQLEWSAAQKKIWPLAKFAKDKVAKSLASSGGAAPSTDVSGDLDRLAVARAEHAALEAVEPLAKRVDGWAGLASNPDELRRNLDVARSILSATARLAESPEELIAVRGAIRAVCLDGNELLAEGMPISQAGAEYRRAHADFKLALARFRASLTSSDSFDDYAGLDVLRDVCGKISEHRTSLNAWCAWRRACQAAIALDLGPIVVGVTNGSIAPDVVNEVFEVAYARWFSDTRVDACPDLRSFVAVEHEDKIRAFRELDDKLSKASTQAIRATLCGRTPNRDEPKLSPGYTALRRQLQMKRPTKAVRELVGEMGEALTTLTPCLLMSPLSIAQYLPADASLFDLVIFDEASQITPWDAIGAIARARQVIVAGDPKQMPPTNFFARAAGDADEDEDGEVEDQESVLQECLSAGIPQHRLTWHYRSRHESLIAFSNHRYYDCGFRSKPAGYSDLKSASVPT